MPAPINRHVNASLGFALQCSHGFPSLHFRQFRMKCTAQCKQAPVHPPVLIVAPSAGAPPHRLQLEHFRVATITQNESDSGSKEENGSLSLREVHLRCLRFSERLLFVGRMLCFTQTHTALLCRCAMQLPWKGWPPVHSGFSLI